MIKITCEIAIDSTRISIYNNSYNHNKENVRKYNSYYQIKKTACCFKYKKLMVCMKCTNSRPFTGILDAEAINKIFVAYDIVSIYKQCKKYNIQPVIRPRKYAKVYEKVDYLSERNSSIIVIKSCESHEKGKERWKKV